MFKNIGLSLWHIKGSQNADEAHAELEFHNPGLSVQVVLI